MSINVVFPEFAISLFSLLSESSYGGGGGWSSYELEFSLHHPLRAPRAVFHRSAVNSSPPRQHCPLDLSVVVEMVSR